MKIYFLEREYQNKSSRKRFQETYKKSNSVDELFLIKMSKNNKLNLESKKEITNNLKEELEKNQKFNNLIFYHSSDLEYGKVKELLDKYTNVIFIPFGGENTKVPSENSIEDLSKGYINYNELSKCIDITISHLKQLDKTNQTFLENIENIKNIVWLNREKIINDYKLIYISILGLNTESVFNPFHIQELKYIWSSYGKKNCEEIISEIWNKLLIE